MKVGIVVVTHSYDMAPLHASAQASAHELHWYIHHHGGRNPAARFLRSLEGRAGVQVAWHFHNRGLSASWNDGLLASRAAGNDVTLLVNDDVHFEADGLDRFLAFVEARDRSGLCFVVGREPSGVARNQGLACCALGHDVLDAVGCFDENFFPAYYEDFDYIHRVALAGLPIHLDERVLVFHQRNGTSKGRRLFQLLLKWHQHRSGRYYRAKWRLEGERITTNRPFADARASLRIAWEDRADPYRHLGRGKGPGARLLRWAAAPGRFLTRGAVWIEARAQAGQADRRS